MHNTQRADLSPVPDALKIPHTPEAIAAAVAAAAAASTKSSPTSYLNLTLEADPHAHKHDPLIHLLTGQKLVPLHLLQADYHLTLSPPVKPLGHINPQVLHEMIIFEENRPFPVFTFFPRLSATEVIASAIKCVAFHPDLFKEGPKALSLGIEAFIWFMRDRGSMRRRIFYQEDVYSIYADPRSTGFADSPGELGPWQNVAMTILRMPTLYFGTPWIGVSMIVYEGEGDDLVIWAQKRSAHVASGGLLDTTAGGAVETRLSAWDGMSKEAEEEASISEGIVRKYATYEESLQFYLYADTNPTPLVHLCFDLKRPDPSSPDYASTQPKVCDDEVDDFVPMTIADVKQALQDRRFGTGAAIDLVAFMMRKGFITRENEPDFDKIIERFNRPQYVAFPHRLTEIAKRGDGGSDWA